MAHVYAPDDALEVTLNDNERLDSLATRLETPSPKDKSELRKQAECDATGVHSNRASNGAAT